jgi:hypothetical protein
VRGIVSSCIEAESTDFSADRYFNRSVEEHVQEFENPAAWAVERARTEEAQIRQSDLMRTFQPELKTWKDDNTVPVVLPAHGEQTSVNYKPVDFDLLHRLLPDFNKLTPEMAVHEGVNTVYDDLLGSRWIRLLILEPRSKRRFSCHIRAVQLEDAMGKYEAVSYCWEGSKKQNVDRNADHGESIICNGLPKRLKPNLYSALRELRFQKLSRILWIDALCIDQTNKPECASQVQMMGDIYRNASRVIIWLGSKEPNHSAKAFDAVCQLINNWDTSCSASYNTKTRTNQRNEDRLASGHYHFQCLDFVPIFEASWFERRWVLQEAVLAREVIVVVPDATIPWKWIMVASGILRTRYLRELIACGIHTNVCNAYLMARLSGRMGMPALKPNFLHLLRLTTEFKTTVPLDIVFALLGLAPVTGQAAQGPLIPVNYTWTLEELMRRTTEKFISLPEPLAFLSDAGDAWGGAEYEWPSWLPHYGHKDYTMLDPWALDGSAFNPASTLSFKRWPTENKSELVVEGIYFSPVVKDSRFVLIQNSSNIRWGSCCPSCGASSQTLTTLSD